MLYRGSEVMREVGWVVFDEIHYMRDKGMINYLFLKCFSFKISYKLLSLKIYVSDEHLKKIEFVRRKHLKICCVWDISERGVVWEETIILLPDNVHYVFLSATIPNARQFAEWICHLHKQVTQS